MEDNPYAKAMELELQAERNKNTQLSNSQMSLYGMPSEDNLIRWQLDLKEDLDKIYHLLKGHQIKEDEQGNVVYVEPATDDLKPFNEFGVQLIMNIMSFYLNRNTLLSYYEEDMINWKVKDFGEQISDLILCRFMEMGMNTPSKIKMYPIIVQELIDTVHSSYLRALEGGERESLRTARTVHQNEGMGNNMMQRNMNSGMMQQQKKFSLFRPSSWI